VRVEEKYHPGRRRTNHAYGIGMAVDCFWINQHGSADLQRYHGSKKKPEAAKGGLATPGIKV
jgi:hypothetical protein